MLATQPAKPRNPRRRGALPLVLLATSVATACGSPAGRSAESPPSAPASGAPSTAQQEQGMSWGPPFRDPANLNTAAPSGLRGPLRLHLVAEPTLFDLAGKKV